MWVLINNPINHQSISLSHWHTYNGFATIYTKPWRPCTNIGELTPKDTPTSRNTVLETPHSPQPHIWHPPPRQECRVASLTRPPLEVGSSCASWHTRLSWPLWTGELAHKNRGSFGPQRLLSELHVVKRHSLTRNDQQEEKRCDERFVYGPSCALLICPVKHLHTGCSRDVEVGRQPRFPLSQQHDTRKTQASSLRARSSCILCSVIMYLILGTWAVYDCDVVDRECQGQGDCCVCGWQEE